MNLIVACDLECSIGREGGLLTYLPEDLKRFKKITMDNIMIMGRKTVDSLPGGRLLPDRQTWILTHDLSYKKEGAKIFHSFEHINAFIKKKRIPTSSIFVCGGAEIYKLFLPYCKKAYITQIHHSFKGDVYIPDVSEMPGWYLTYRSDLQKYKEIRYEYLLYENKSYTQLPL